MLKCAPFGHYLVEVSTLATIMRVILVRGGPVDAADAGDVSAVSEAAVVITRIRHKNQNNLYKDKGMLIF